MGLQRRLLLRATRVRMGQLVNRPGAPTLSSFVFLDTMAPRWPFSSARALCDNAQTLSIVCQRRLGVARPTSSHGSGQPTAVFKVDA